jgi:hypothetical protein
MGRTPAYDEAYPRELWRHERAHLRARVPGRPLPDDRPSRDVVGVALSGGGIRSATFCLGVFQALARLGQLARIDYISTVSGGGYFGSFLGRLYQRKEVADAEQVRALLDPAGTASQRPAGVPDVVAWLRENGRYLSPNGAGDLLIGAAIMLRNWVTIHVVVLSFALLLLVTGQLARLALEVWSPGWGLDQSQARGWLWWSPWIVLPGLTFVWGAVPLAWAFWMTGLWRRHRPVIEWPVWGVVLTAVIALGLVGGWRPVAWAGWPQVGALVLIAIVLTWVAWGFALYQTTDRETEFPSFESRKVFEIDRQRNLLSTYLKVALVVTGACLAFALVDSIGQTLYLVRMRSARGFNDLYAVLVTLAGAVAFAQRIATALAGRTNGGRLRLPVAALVTVGALAVAALVLISLSVLAHALSWQFHEPSGGPVITWTAASPSRAAFKVEIRATAGGAVTTTVAAPELPRPADRSCDTGGAGPCVRGAGTLRIVGLVWAILLVFAFLFGQCWSFINQSSLQSMYSARLTRAYLGASNPRRKGVDRERITDVVPDDNIDPADYWPSAPMSGADPKARPLHLINVTINETVDGRSNVQRQDRKGTGLALGPCAFSVGIRHHAVFESHQVFRAAGRQAPGGREGVTVYPPPTGAGGPGYRVFAAGAGPGWPGGESLSIGKWTGISGAAFSTGLGARTSLGLSLLCGLANVRLGYWWDSGVSPDWRSGGRRPGRLERAFAVQSYLLSEFLSRFYGTSRARWYLSDGGHFENMGAYELIRRRLARILVIDAEADPDYTFDGLSDLIRKARLDFGAEIEFLSEKDIEACVPQAHRRLFGTLEQLRRGKWSREPVKDRLVDRLRLTVEEPVDEARHSLAHAALARVTFVDEPGWEGWLLYIKPTLVGDEPTDIVQYHRAHFPFPQETTADQFFDEAQWESYRMLGYHIGVDVLGTGVPAATGPTSVPPSPAARIFG